MSCESPETYTCSGIGSEVLAHQSLRYVQITDPMLGSAQVGVPSGPLNAELYKLLQNDCKLAETIHQYFTRTHGTDVADAPAVDTIVLPLAGAPVSPADNVIHVVFFSNAEVTYQFNGTSGLWEEIGRASKPYTAVDHYRAVLTIPVVTGDDNITFNIPTEDDNATTVAFTLEDIKIIYVNNLDTNAPVVGVIPGLTPEGGGAIRTVLTSEPVDGSDYEVVVIFEKVVIS